MTNYVIELNRKLSKFINTYNYISKIPRGYGTDLEIYTSEIHMIEILGSYPEVRIVDITELTGLTKGTISKTIKKLEEKELLIKYHPINNQRDIYYKLTKLGWEAYHGHDLHHEKRNKKVYDLIRNSSEKEKRFLIEFLDSYTDILESYKDRE